MKIIPIQIEKLVKTDHKFIDWKIHNVCNYNCSFCRPHHKDGSQRWFTIDKYKEYANKIIDACDGAPAWFLITGGEPTLYPDLLLLLEYLKSKNAMVGLISNGSRTLRWWKELQESHILNYLFITYHSEQTDNYQHVAEVLNLFHHDPIETTGFITHTIDSFERACVAREYLLNNTGAVISMIPMTFGEFNIYDKYNDTQLKKLIENNRAHGKLRDTKILTNLPDQYKLNHMLKITFNKPGIVIEQDPQILKKYQQNNFYGWECKIGNDNMRIDYDIKYRGTCEVGGNQSLNDEKISFNTDYTICTSHGCNCGADMVSFKKLPDHLIPKE